jgi:WD40 repeat protein
MALAEAHPSVEELTAFALGQSDSALHASIESHLATCPFCQERATATPGDGLVELLRRAHAGAGGSWDTSTEAPTLPPSAPPGEAPTCAAAGRSESPEVVPPELDRHGRYRLVRLLGQGGMGAVYEAEHRVMQRPVALKVINRTFTAKASAVERFRREARAAARLSHPNIVAAYDAENAGDTHFLVMEYVKGTTLGRLVRERGPLPVAEACEYARQAALGLQHAHERGMVHRDVKPDNLIRCEDGTVKVLDFGLASLTAEHGAAGLTEANVVMGTPEYMAPEQAADARTADVRADVYSLGCTLFHLLTGRVPYPAPTPKLKVVAHREQPVPPVREERPEVPPGLEAVVARMLAKKPEGRYQTPGEVAAALAPFTQPAQPPRKRRPHLVGLAAAVLFVGSVLAGIVVYRIQTDKGELVITTESDDVDVIVRKGGKVVEIIDTKTKKSIRLDSGTYELELKGAPKGLRLTIGKVTLTRGETVLAKIERIPVPPPPPPPEKIKEVRRIRWRVSYSLWDIALSPDGGLLLAGADRDEIRVWDVRSGKQLHKLTGGGGDFLPGGKQILTHCGIGPSQFRVYDSETGRQIRDFGGPATGGATKWVTPDGKTVGVGNRGVQMWDIATGKLLVEVGGGSYGYFTSDSKYCFVNFPATAKKATHWRVWDLTGVERTERFRKMLDGGGVVLFPGSREALRDMGCLKVIDVATGKEVRQLRWERKLDAEVREFGQYGFSPDYRSFLTAHRDDTFRLHAIDGETLREIGRINLANAEFFRFSADGRYAAAASRDGHLVVIRLPDPKPAKDKP